MAFRDLIIDKVKEAKDLPTLPSVFTKMQEVLSDSASSADDVAQVLKDDVALTTKILKVANSAAYATDEPISSVSFAISRIGFGQTGNIAMSLSIMDMFNSGTGRVDYTSFWKHSLSVAFLMPVLSERIKKLSKAPKVVFTTGLLHDVGLFVLDQYGGDLYNSVLSMVEGSGRSLIEIEREIMGTDHAEIGGILLERWNLPDMVVNAVKSHHEEAAREIQWVSPEELVYLSNIACKKYGIFNGIDSAGPDYDEELWARHGLVLTDLDFLEKKVEQLSSQSEVLLAVSS